jgi:hypothetical protein
VFEEILSLRANTLKAFPSVLINAVETNNVEYVKMMLKYAEYLQTTGGCLHSAVKVNNPKILTLLLQSNLKDRDLHNPAGALDLAASKGFLDCVKILCAFSSKSEQVKHFDLQT